MDKKNIETFAATPQIEQKDWGFIDDIKSPLEYHFQEGRGCDPKENRDCMQNGFELYFETSKEVPQTALKSLRRVMKAKNIAENLF